MRENTKEKYFTWNVSKSYANAYFQILDDESKQQKTQPL